MKRNRITSFCVLPLAILILSGCTTNRTVYEEYRKFDGLSWNRFNILNFTMQLENVENTYDIFINIRHLPEVPYEEMVINFTLFTPSGDMRSADYTLDFYGSEGKRMSECMGDYCDLLVPLRSAFRFFEPGQVRFEIENKFTKIEMPGILEVGLVVRESQSGE